MKPLTAWSVILIVSVALIMGAFYFDVPLRNAIVKTQGRGWKSTFEYQVISKISRYGDWPEIAITGILGAVLAWRIRRREWAEILIAAVLASTVSGIIANCSRLTTGRTRPRESPKIEQGFYGPWHNGKLLIGNSKYNSFPSGHAATAVGFAGVLLFAKPIAGLFAMALALAIGWARIALGAHHLSDIIVSTILGLIVAWFMWRWVQEYGDRVVNWAHVRWMSYRMHARRDMRSKEKN